MRWVLGIEYDGSRYCGWQSQSCGCGIQDHIEQAIAKIAGHPIRVHVAGRTDTGVHATSQIAHFDTEIVRQDDAWVRGVNAFLPADITVLWARQVSDIFHARFDAQRRSYQYLLLNHAVRPALMHAHAGWFHLPLRLDAMDEAIQYLRGEHDFSTFRAAECQAKSPVKQMVHAAITRTDDYFVFEFTANAFLHHQIRNMVGALIYVGKGALKPIQIKRLLESKDRTKAPPTFAPNGLYLTGVAYDARWDLPETQRRLQILL